MSASPSPSPAQIAANQANAQHSTGPRTPEGRAIVAKNRTTHGLVGAHTILPSEDPNVFADLLTRLRQDLVPQGPAEAFLVDSVAHAQWKLARIAGWEAEITAAAFDNQPVPEPLAKILGATHEQALLRLSRYETSARRALHQAMTQLRSHRKALQVEQLVSKRHGIRRFYRPPMPVSPATADQRNRSNPISAPAEAPAGPAAALPAPDNASNGA
jgi:hypothetical protein